MESKQSNVSSVGINFYSAIGRYSPLKFSWFEPSSTVKVELCRYRYGNIIEGLVGKYEGKVIDLVENGE